MKSTLLNLFVIAGQFLLLSLLFPPLLLAQETTADSLKIYNIDEVVITGSRSAMDKSKAPQKIEVISEEDIQLTPYQDFTDILKNNSSIDIIQFPGLLSGVGIRGFRPQIGGLNHRVLLLINGRPAGTSNLSTINLQNIERVEVLKGPASSLYGSQAMGGVVNVITKKSDGPVRSSIFAEYGSYKTFNFGGSTGGNISDKLDFDLSFLSYNQNENYKLGSDNLLRGLVNGDEYTLNFNDGTSSEGKDERGDGSRREYSKLNYYTGSLRLGYKISEAWKVSIFGDQFVARNVGSSGDLFFGNGRPNSQDIERESGALLLEGTVNKHQLSVKGYVSGETNDNYTLTNYMGEFIPPYLSFQSSTNWKGIQVKDILDLGKHALTFGVDYNVAGNETRAFNQDNTEGAPYSPNYEIKSTGIYAQGQIRLLKERLILRPGARFDYITYDVKDTPLLENALPGEESNPFFSPNLGMHYQATKFISAHATIGKAFVTPDAHNVAGYSQSVFNKQAAITEGNPNLETENSVTWDAGIRIHQWHGFTADLTYFSTKIQDRITRRTTYPSQLEFNEKGDTIISRTTYINANKGSIKGLEFELSYDFGVLNNYDYSLRLFANATKIIEAKEITVNEGGPDTKQDIYNVSDFNSTFGLDFNNFKWLHARLSGRYVGKRKDTEFNDPLYPEIEYPAFMVMDFMIALTYEKQHTISVSVDNLTDENYYEKRGFNLPGRIFKVRYGYTF